MNFSNIAKSMNAEGIRVENVTDIKSALNTAFENQKQGKTTVVEIMVTRELGDPYRRDAMKLPHRLLEKYASTNEEIESITGQPWDWQEMAEKDTING